MTSVKSAFTHAKTWTQDAKINGLIPDAVIGIADSNGLIKTEVIGDVHLEARYPLFSVTKPIVAIGAMREVERGTINLNVPLQDIGVLVGATGFKSVTLEHLLSHTSGISEPALDCEVSLNKLLLTAKQDFTPGTRFRYSSLAFAGVSTLLEHVSHRPLDNHLTELLSIADAKKIDFDSSKAHPISSPKEAHFDAETFFSKHHPGAGLVGDVHSLLNLGTEMLRIFKGETSLLAADTLQDMLRPRTLGLPDLTPFDQRREYGLAWHIRSETQFSGHKIFGHSGWSGTQWWICPETDLCLVLLTAVEDIDKSSIDFDQLLQALTRH